MPETQQKEVMKDYLDFRGAADKSYPSPRDGEQVRSFWLLFPSTLFSFLLLMGLIIFSEKTHDLGRGVTAGGHWAPAGAACVCGCLRVFVCVAPAAPNGPAFPVARQCRLLVPSWLQTSLGPWGSPG